MTALQTKQEELAKKLEEVSKLRAEIQKLEKVEPVFSDDSGDLTHDKSHFPRLLKWQRARVKIIEKINIANKGDNGFKVGKGNCYIFIECENGVRKAALNICTVMSIQNVEPMLYIRTKEAAEELLEDPKFCEDLKMYFKGWL